jgi:hypothetical protein
MINLYGFDQEIDGHKLQPFLNKKFITVPRKIEETYYEKFVAPLIGSFNVKAQGFKHKKIIPFPVPVLRFL